MSGITILLIVVILFILIAAAIKFFSISGLKESRLPYLKKKYSDFWEEVESGVMDDLNHLFETEKNDDSEFYKKRQVIAHNAAFIACNAVQKRETLNEIIKSV